MSQYLGFSNLKNIRLVDSTNTFPKVSANLDQPKRERHQHKMLINDALARLIDLMPMGIICLNNQGCVAEANQVAKNLFDVDVQGRVWREIISSEFSPKRNDGHEISLKNGKVVSIQTRPISLDFDSSLSLAQILIICDMTETREYQAQLSRERRVVELGAMSARLAHQIRTPLSTAILYANHLSNYKLDANQRKKSANKLLIQLTSIEKQMKDMLFYIKGEIPIEERSSVRSLVMMVEQRVEGLREQKNVRIKVDICLPQVTINCHEDALVGAISNLVCNAIEASDEASDGGVELKSFTKKNQWFVEILDKGKGISESEMKKLFTPFFTTKQDGNGLGLTTAKAIIESHQGRLSIRSEQDKGTLVEVRIPLSDQAEVLSAEFAHN